MFVKSVSLRIENMYRYVYIFFPHVSRCFSASVISQGKTAAAKGLEERAEDKGAASMASVAAEGGETAEEITGKLQAGDVGSDSCDRVESTGKG